MTPIICILRRMIGDSHFTILKSAMDISRNSKALSKDLSMLQLRPVKLDSSGIQETTKEEGGHCGTFNGL